MSWPQIIMAGYIGLLVVSAIVGDGNLRTSRASGVDILLTAAALAAVLHWGGFWN